MCPNATSTNSAPNPAVSDGPPPLEAFIHVRPGYLRATNVEQHGEHAQHYIPTGRALDILGRITRTLRGHGAGHAWSLTGPYGAGKSSFALFLRTLLGPAGPGRDAAEQRLMLASQATWQSLADTGHRSDRGFVLATTTCQRESVTDSLLRAVQRGAADYWGRRLPRALVDPLHQFGLRRRMSCATCCCPELSQNAEKLGPRPPAQWPGRGPGSVGERLTCSARYTDARLTPSTREMPATSCSSRHERHPLLLELTGSGLGVSGAVVAEILPVLLLAPLAGSLVDRLPRVRVMVAADVWRAVLAAVLAVAHGEVAVAYAVAFGLSAGAVFFNPAAQSVLPALVDQDELVTPTPGSGPPQ